MALEGSIQEFGLADILQLIHIQKKTGVLKINSRKDEVNITFLSGCIVEINSDKMPAYTRLLEIFLRRNVIKQEDFEDLGKSKKKNDIKVFVKKGLVSHQDFFTAMESVVIDTLVYLFTWKDGSYEFISKNIARNLAAVDPPLDTQQLLMESMRIVDELFIIEGKLDLDLVYQKITQPDKSSLDPIEYRVYTLIDGVKDVSMLINETHMEYLETAKALIALDDKQIIHAAFTKPLLEKKIIRARRSQRLRFSIIVTLVLVIIFFYTLRHFSNFFEVVGKRHQVLVVESLKMTLDTYYAQNQHYPETLKGFQVTADRWGRPYVYKRTQNGFMLFSMGPDGAEGTEDDVY
jgi:hypothetical protein